MDLPALIGVIHLPPLPGSPRHATALDAIVASAARDAEALAKAGFEAVMVENFGDAPFARGAVEPVTVAAMTRCALAVREAAPALPLGINVLRNDAQAALGIAAAVGAQMVRINVHIGAQVSDQGVIEGDAHNTLRTKRALGLDGVALLCDVAVKHAAPLGTPRDIVVEAKDLALRGLADAVLITGAATGASASAQTVERVAEALDTPVYIASGARADALDRCCAHGVIVGSALRADGRPGGPIDLAAAQTFADAWRHATG